MVKLWWLTKAPLNVMQCKHCADGCIRSKMRRKKSHVWYRTKINMTTNEPSNFQFNIKFQVFNKFYVGIL